MSEHFAWVEFSKTLGGLLTLGGIFQKPGLSFLPPPPRHGTGKMKARIHNLTLTLLLGEYICPQGFYGHMYENNDVYYAV